MNYTIEYSAKQVFALFSSTNLISHTHWDYALPHRYFSRRMSDASSYVSVQKQVPWSCVGHFLSDTIESYKSLLTRKKYNFPDKNIYLYNFCIDSVQKFEKNCIRFKYFQL